jgi:hypothetical protein
MCAVGVPHAAQGGVTTIGLAMWAQDLASCSRSKARAWGVLSFGLAYLVKAYFDGFPDQDAVAAVDAFPLRHQASIASGQPCVPAVAAD